MRDFRDAKAMARTLRVALAAKGFKITISQSLELIAEIFGVADWNTLSAAISRDARNPGNNVSRSPLPTAEPVPRALPPGPPLFSSELLGTLSRALVDADQRQHEYITLEHLLFALVDDIDASAVMKACKVDLGALKEDLSSYIGFELKILRIDDGREPTPTAAFQRVVHRARLRLEALGGEVSGSDLLLAMLDEAESPAVSLLAEHGMTREGAATSVLREDRRGVRKRRIQPVVIRRSKKRR